MENLAAAINPDIRELVYGKKELKKIILYPLSIGDQFKVTEFITEIIQSLGSSSLNAMTDFAVMAVMSKALEDNLVKVLMIVTALSEKEAQVIIDELTNIQFMGLAEYIWEVNYEPAIKKGKSLFERGKNVFDLKRPLLSSSSITPSTDLNTFTDGATKMED